MAETDSTSSHQFKCPACQANLDYGIKACPACQTAIYYRDLSETFWNTRKTKLMQVSDAIHR